MLLKFQNQHYFEKYTEKVKDDMCYISGNTYAVSMQISEKCGSI